MDNPEDTWAELPDADWARIEAEHRAYVARNRQVTPGWSENAVQEDDSGK